MSCQDSKESQANIDCDTDFSTANILVDINQEIFNNDESVNTYSKYSWSTDGINRLLSGNGIPNHEVGTFPNDKNPNQIKEQNISKHLHCAQH